jgi:hypothetical protein
MRIGMSRVIYITGSARALAGRWGRGGRGAVFGWTAGLANVGEGGWGGCSGSGCKGHWCEAGRG